MCSWGPQWCLWALFALAGARRVETWVFNLGAELLMFEVAALVQNQPMIAEKMSFRDLQ